MYTRIFVCVMLHYLTLSWQKEIDQDTDVCDLRVIPSVLRSFFLNFLSDSRFIIISIVMVFD